MEKIIIFTIKYSGIRKKSKIESLVDVPENWMRMSYEEQEKYLTKNPSHNSGQWVLHKASIFQKISADEEVDYFTFETK